MIFKFLLSIVSIGALAFSVAAAPFTTTVPIPVRVPYENTNVIDVTGAEVSAANGEYQLLGQLGSALIYSNVVTSYFLVWDYPSQWYWALYEGWLDDGNVIRRTIVAGVEQLTNAVWVFPETSAASTFSARYRLGYKPKSIVPVSTEPPVKHLWDFHFFTFQPDRKDKDGEKFWARAHLTDATEKAAIKTLVMDLKFAGVWKKLYAFYPFVGGTAASCAQSLVNDQFPIVWHGYVTFVNGITGDGATGFGAIDFGPGNGLADIPVHYADQFNFASFRGGNSDSYQVVFGAVEHRDPDNPNALVGRTIIRNNGAAGVWMGNYGDWHSVTWNSGSPDGAIYADSDFDKNQTSIWLGTASAFTGDYLENMRGAVLYTVLAENRAVFDGVFSPAAPRRFFSGTVTCLAFGAPLSNTEIQKFTTAVNRFLTTLNRFP